MRGLSCAPTEHADEHAWKERSSSVSKADTPMIDLGVLGWMCDSSAHVLHTMEKDKDTNKRWGSELSWSDLLSG